MRKDRTFIRQFKVVLSSHFKIKEQTTSILKLDLLVQEVRLWGYDNSPSSENLQPKKIEVISVARLPEKFLLVLSALSVKLRATSWLNVIPVIKVGHKNICYHLLLDH